MFGCHERPHLNARERPRPDLECAHHRGEFGDQPVRRALADSNGSGDRHAALACRSIGGAEQGLGGNLRIRVRHHDHVVFCAAERLHAFAVRGRGRIDVLGNRRRADETDRGNVGVSEQGLDGLTIPVHDVEHAGRQARVREQFRQPHAERRILLRGLQDERVAAGDCDREHPHRNHRRKIERRDAGAHADRLTQRPAVDAAAHAVREFAFEQVRNAARELHDFDTAHHLAARVGQDLAVFTRNDAGKVVDVTVERLLEPEHHASAQQRRRRRPGRERGTRAGYCPGRLLLAGERHPCRDVARGRIVNIAGTAAGPGDACPADEMFEFSGPGQCDRGVHGWTPDGKI